MEIEIKIPSVGESVQEAVLVQWYKKDGDTVEKDEPLFVVETDKVTLEIVAEASGILKIQGRRFLSARKSGPSLQKRSQLRNRRRHLLRRSRKHRQWIRMKRSK